MTSPSTPSRKPAPVRTTRASSGGHRASDPDARFTRNVTLGFIVIIAAIAAVVLFGIIYAFWDANLKPMATVYGSQVGRGQWEDRERLETFRAERAQTATRAALLAGQIDEDAANARLTAANQSVSAGASGAMEDLVTLLVQKKLATDRGITLSDEELAAAMAKDGTLPELRRIAALVITPAGAATGTATAEDIAAARASAEEALAALRSGTPIADLVDEYSPATASAGGDIGYYSREELQSIDPAWAETLFALGEGEAADVTDLGGQLVVGVVSKIAPELADDGFAAAVSAQVGEAVQRSNVGLEALAAKLEADVTAQAVAAEYDQVRLAEILVAGDTTLTGDADQATIRARHILYKPEASASPSPSAGASPVPSADPAASPTPLPSNDPGWAVAEAEADAAFAALGAITDVDAREAAFAERARAESDDTVSASAGGELGYFTRASMVEPFADALFDAVDPQPGDIIGPVRSDFGWHVIMYEDTRAPLAERLATVTTALAADGADFATVARDLSDGETAADGGDIGWKVVDQLGDALALALAAVDVGGVTEPVDESRGWVFYEKAEAASRPLDPADAQAMAATAYDDWYQVQREQADEAGEVSIDGAVYATDSGT